MAHVVQMSHNDWSQIATDKEFMQVHGQMTRNCMMKSSEKSSCWLWLKSAVVLCSRIVPPRSAAILLGSECSKPNLLGKEQPADA